MSARLTGRGWGVVAVLIGSIALGFALRYPEAVGIGMGTLVLLVVAYFLVSGGGPVWATATAQPRVERRADTAVRVDVDAARAHRRGLRLVAPGALAHPVVWDETGIHADVPIPTQRRGPVSLGPWSLERVDPWGLLSRRVGEAEGVAVLAHQGGVALE